EGSTVQGRPAIRADARAGDARLHRRARRYGGSSCGVEAMASTVVRVCGEPSGEKEKEEVIWSAPAMPALSFRREERRHGRRTPDRESLPRNADPPVRGGQLHLAAAAADGACERVLGFLGDVDRHVGADRSVAGAGLDV